MSTTLKKKGGCHPSVDYDWYAFCQALYTGIEGEDWEEMCEVLQRNEQGGGIVKKPQEAQKAKALWKMKAAEEAGEEYYDPTREHNIKGRNETRLALWEEHPKDPIVALDIGFSHKPRKKPTAATGESTFPKVLGPRPLILVFHTLQGDLGGRLALLGSD